MYSNKLVSGSIGNTYYIVTKNNVTYSLASGSDFNYVTSSAQLQDSYLTLFSYYYHYEGVTTIQSINYNHTLAQVARNILGSKKFNQLSKHYRKKYNKDEIIWFLKQNLSKNIIKKDGISILIHYRHYSHGEEDEEHDDLYKESNEENEENEETTTNNNNNNTNITTNNTSLFRMDERKLEKANELFEYLQGLGFSSKEYSKFKIKEVIRWNPKNKDQLTTCKLTQKEINLYGDTILSYLRRMNIKNSSDSSSDS